MLRELQLTKELLTKLKPNGKPLDWKMCVLDSYKVLLSYPNYTNPNRIRLWAKDGTLIYNNTGVSPVIIPDEQGSPNVGVQWLAYSANGKFKGEPIYCNYGTSEDFKQLDKWGISLKGKIALIRYGRIFRGDKIKLAQERGASAAILYSDPQDVAPEGTGKEHVYPATDYMPSYAVQRGSLKEMEGDPLTPFYPAKKDLYSRTTIEEIRKLNQIPSIPVLPLSYGDAYPVLTRMKGKSVPEEWQGGFNFTYSVGDKGMENGIQLEVDVHSTLEKRQIQNVIGYIHGEVEKDRYVLLGNHFDAWVYGALDPNSGTAILSEVARAMVEARQKGVWRPRRTIVFCNWDGEEHGLVGSAEFVENYQNQLTQRAVAYFNVDLIFGNGSFSANAVPTLYNAVVETAKLIPNPLKSEVAAGRKTVFDTWYYVSPGNVKELPGFPELTAPGGGSDHERFMSYLGVPVVDFRFVRSDKNPRTNTTYPLYHTLYETKFVNEHLFDHDNFAVHAATARYWSELVRRFAEPATLQLNVSMLAHRFLDGYARDLKTEVDSLAKSISGMEQAQQQVALFIRNIQEFVRRADAFYSSYVRHYSTQLGSDGKSRPSLYGWNLEDELELRAKNDRLMAVDRCFVSPTGVPGTPLNRNILFSTSELNSYASKVMPGIYDQISYLKALQFDESNDETQEIINHLTEQISIVQWAIQCATNTLSDFL
ncbi:Glutamate carboxypeptidase 2-like family protein [Aphelenchoides bicaudatus]|nr:Glutamate carboxypeptidase 2-like family protein [Aphelenchoides bicaudatus]